MIKTILKRVGFLFLVIVMGVTGFCVGYGVVFAHIIPGWDRPFDPPNYYDPDRISWADTNNPSFFFRDLGWQGGKVYDHSRDIQSAYEKENILGWLKLLLENMALQLKNHKPLDGTILHDIAVKLQETQQNTKNLDQSDTAAKLLQSTILRDMNRYDDDTNDYDPKEQAKAIGDTYASYANAAADSQKDAEEVSKTVDELLEAANQAEGDMQIQQIKSQLSGLEESEKARQNALLAQLAQLRAIDQKSRRMMTWPIIGRSEMQSCMSRIRITPRNGRSSSTSSRKGVAGLNSNDEWRNRQCGVRHVISDQYH